MELRAITPLKLDAAIERWPLVQPFRISGYTFETIEVLVVRLESEGQVGVGEATGVYYKQDTAPSMIQQIEAVRRKIEAGLTGATVQALLPAGGARSALDCAYWDLCAKLTGRPVWDLVGLQTPRALITTFGCGADTPENMASVAKSYEQARAIKLKLTGQPIDVDRVRAVREARPDVWLGVDANQGFSKDFLVQIMPVFTEARVALIEQPLPVGQEAQLDGFQSPIPLAADETVQSLADIPAILGRFSVVNIKLDKCGGLTEALAMARAANKLGVETMVGNMIGTSLGMAPAILVGQLCSVVDLDGPIFLKSDRNNPVRYSDGLVSNPVDGWGSPT